MPEKFRFTKPALTDLKPRDKRWYGYDESCPGLAICVTPSGAKTFYRCGRLAGRGVRVKLGEFPEMTVDQARVKAAKVAGQLASGKNPIAEARENREQKTVKDAFEWYLENVSKPQKITWQRDQRRFDRTCKGWLTRPLASLTRAEIVERFNAIGKKSGGGAANAFLDLMRNIYSSAIDNGWVTINPIGKVERFPKPQRERFLDAYELAKWFDAVNSLQREVTRDFFFLLLWTGARRENVMSMRWEEVDMQAALWLIPAEKFKGRKSRKKSHTIPLSSQAMTILTRRREATVSPWVFPGQSKSGRMTDPSAAWAQIVARSGLRDIRIHDIRRTLASWQAMGGSSLLVIGKMLGHSSAESTQIYARLQLGPVRDSMTAASNAIEAAGEKKIKNVENNASLTPDSRQPNAE